MNVLQEKYANNSNGCRFQIFGFPSNQFGYQEPAENFELMNCLKYVRPGGGFVPYFPLAGKGDVNGINESPVFSYLKSRCPAPMGLIANRSDVTWTPIRSSDISWNFQKWLISSNGHPYRRYTSRTTPQMVEQDIIKLLAKCKQDNAVESTQNNSASSPPPPFQKSNSPTETKKLSKRSIFDVFF